MRHFEGVKNLPFLPFRRSAASAKPSCALSRLDRDLRVRLEAVSIFRWVVWGERMFAGSVGWSSVYCPASPPAYHLDWGTAPYRRRRRTSMIPYSCDHPYHPCLPCLPIRNCQRSVYKESIHLVRRQRSQKHLLEDLVGVRRVETTSTKSTSGAGRVEGERSSRK